MTAFPILLSVPLPPVFGLLFGAAIVFGFACIVASVVVAFRQRGGAVPDKEGQGENGE